MSDWSMPEWMEKYRETIETPEGLTVEDCMRGQHGFYSTSVVAVQALLLHRLRVVGALVGESDETIKELGRQS